jgi:hypothetical protein
MKYSATADHPQRLAAGIANGTASVIIRAQFKNCASK